MKQPSKQELNSTKVSPRKTMANMVQTNKGQFKTVGGQTGVTGSKMKSGGCK